MTSRIYAQTPPSDRGGQRWAVEASSDAALQLPEVVREPFSAAMSQSMLLPAFMALCGVGAALFMVRFAGARTERISISVAEDLCQTARRR